MSVPATHFLLFEMLFCVTLGRSCSYGVYMAMGHHSICQSISSVDVLFLNNFPHLFNIFILENDVENAPKTHESS